MLSVKRHKRSPFEQAHTGFCALTIVIVCMWHLRLAGMPRLSSIARSSSTQRDVLLSILVPIPRSAPLHSSPPHPTPSTHPTVSLSELLKQERLKIDLDLSLAGVEKTPEVKK